MNMVESCQLEWAEHGEIMAVYQLQAQKLYGRDAMVFRMAALQGKER